MGKGKKKFIEKANATVYQVVHQTFDEDGFRNPSVSLKPKVVKKKDNRGDEGESYYGEEDDYYDEEDQDYYAATEKESIVIEEVEVLRFNAERSGFNSRDRDPEGLPIDGYDYSKHLKPIGDDPSAIFLPAGGGLVGAKEVAGPTQQKPPATEEDEIFEVLLPSADAAPDDEIEEALRLLEEKPGFQVGTGDFQGMEDDFVLMATAGPNYQHVINKEIELDQQLGEEGGGDGLVVEEHVAVPPPDDKNVGVMNEMFHELLREYDDDEIGELDEMPGGGMDISEFKDVIDDFLETGPYGVFKKPEGDCEKGENEEKENPYDLLDELRAQARKDGTADHVTPITETTEETNAALDSMLATPLRPEWDCETILTTYSNLENHPKYISEPGKLAIKVDRKTGMPIGVLEKASANRKDTAPDNYNNNNNNNTDDADDDDDVVVVNERVRGETAEEKRARKQAVKDAKKMRRQQKKQTKGVFKEEQQKQLRNTLAADKNPNRIRL